MHNKIIGPFLKLTSAKVAARKYQRGLVCSKEYLSIEPQSHDLPLFHYVY